MTSNTLDDQYLNIQMQTKKFDCELSQNYSRRRPWPTVAGFVTTILRRLPGWTLATFVSIAGIAAAQTTVYLPVPNTPLETISVTGCTNATPIVCTSANHGLSNGTAVWIEGFTGNTNADGFFMIGSVTTNTFTLANHLYFSTVPAGNGTSVGIGKLTPLHAYTTIPHPRLFLDGPSGTMTASISNTSTKASSNNRFYTQLQNIYNSFVSSYQTTGIDSYANGSGTGMVRYADAGLYWFASGKSNMTALAMAKWGIDNFEQIVYNPYGFYCNEPNFQCGRDDTTALLHPSEESSSSFISYSLIHDQLSASEVSNFADKIFNDNALVRNPNSPSKGGGFGGIAGDPTTSCTPWPSGAAWDQSQHYCGFWWYIKHEYEPVVITPGNEANYLTDYPGGNLYYQGGWPYAANHGMAHLKSLFEAALALADDDARARSALTQLMAWHLKWRHAWDTSAWTGITENGSRYQQYIDNPYAPEWMISLNQSISGGYDMRGTWSHQELPLEIYGLLPDGGTGAGYGPFTLDQWLDPTGVNSNSTISEWADPVLKMTQLYPSDPLVPYAYWLLKDWNTNQFTTFNWQNFQGGLITQYIEFDPTAAQSAVSALPAQYLFKDTSYSTCQTLWGSQIATHNWSNGTPATDTPGCYPNSSFEHAISKSSWASNATQVLISASWAGNLDRAGGGQYGAYHIYRNGYLLAGNGTGTSPDLATGSARSTCGNCSTLASDEVIEIGGADNWVALNSNANVSASMARWSGADPTGDSQSRYVYAMVDMTPTYATSANVSRAQRHVVHFKKASTQDYIVSYDDVALSSGNQIQAWWHYFVSGANGTNTVSVNTSAKTVSDTLAGNQAELLTTFLPVAGTNTVALLSNGANANTVDTYTCPSTNGTSCNNSAMSGEWMAVHLPSASASATMPTLTQLTVTASGGNAAAVQIADSTGPKVAVFARQAALLTTTSFTTTHSGTAQYLIAGLQAGSYSVTVNGSAISGSPFTVAANDNSLYFESTAGQIQVTQGGTAPPPGGSGQIPAIGSFAASPSSIVAGQSATLSWSATGTPAPTISINNGVGTMGGSSVVVSPSTTTTYTLTATNSAGSATATAAVTVSADTTPPTVPTSVVAQAVSASEINLTWSPSTDLVGVTGYNVYRNGTQIAKTSAASYSSTGLSASTKYTYTVAAYDAAGNVSAQSASASATTMAASGSCSGSTLCVGPGQAYTTIQAAANVAVAGDTVLVFDGTYAGFASVNAGTGSAPIIFKANDSNVIVNSSGDSNGDCINIENTNYVIVDGFTVTGCARAGIRSATTTGVIIRNNVVTNSAQWGIFTGFTPQIQILNNNVSGTAVQHGIYVSNSDVTNDNPIISGNVSFGNAGNGIQVNGDCTTLDANGYTDGVISGAIVQNNVVYNNQQKGFSLISVQNSTIQNNISYNNGSAGAAAGIHLAEQGTCTNDPSSNNIVVNNTMVEPNMAGIRITTGTNNVVFNNIAVSSSPIVDESGGPNSIDTTSNIETSSSTGLFISAASNNYQLVAGSAAVGSGKATYAGASAPTADFAGNARPQSGRWDSGAYEYVTGTPPTCTYTLSASTASYTSAGGTGSVTLTSPSGCSWTATSSASWLKVTAGASGSGSGTVSYSVAANTGSASQSATLTISGQTFTVTESGVACTYTLSASTASYTATGGTGSVAVTCASGCSWTATSSASWLKVTAGASGSGSGTVSYSVAANTGSASQSATLTIGGQTFTVTESGVACTFVLSASTASYTATGGTGSVAVTCASGCSWTATSSASWLKVTAGASGSGSGTVSYSVAANTGSASQSATLTIGGQTFTVTESGVACTFTLSASTASYTSTGGTGSVTVTCTSGCSWTATSSASWLKVTAGASGTASGTVSYSVAANTSSASQSATLTVGGQTFTVTESGVACTFTLSASTASYTSTGGTGSVTVTCTSGCSWTAASSASWLKVTAGASGTASGTVSYSVAANTSSASQSATLTIGGKTFTVTEAGAPCTFALSASTGSYTSAGGTGSVTVTCPSACSWTATSSASWLKVTAGTYGSASGTVSYSVAANTGSASQTGTLTIGGKTFTVTEEQLMVSNLVISPTTAVGGVTVAGTVTLSGPAPSGGAVVTLTSSNLQAATIPSTLTVAAAATSASFSVTTYTQTATETATLSATLNKTTETVSLTVTPPASSVDVIAASYTEVGNIYLYTLSGATITGTKSSFQLNPFGLSYSPDGTLLYVSLTGGSTEVYSVKSGVPFGSPRTLPNPQPSIFGPVVSSDGQFIAVPVDSTSSVAGVQLIQKSGSSYVELPSVTYGSYASLTAAFDPLANHMAVALNGNGSAAPVTPQIFKRSGTTFSRLTGQPSVPFNDTYVFEHTYVAFSPDGAYLYATDGGTDNSGDNMRIYAVSGDAFSWLSGQPNVQPSSPGPIAVSPNDVYIAVSETYTSPYFTIYKRSGSTFTALPPPATLPHSQVQTLTFTPDGKYLVIAEANSPYLLAYSVDASSDIFTPLPAPTLLPPYPFNSLSAVSVP